MHGAHLADDSEYRGDSGHDRAVLALETLPSLDEALALAEGASRWLSAGAAVIGGGCRTGPDDVAALAQHRRDGKW
ncbi:homocysteine S-methyltransferase family protein [Halomonas salinarum]|uniref:homocysteine S-methyltransferase family protein n=1 Tax=Halomonas salinarum TaxID=1158993 RepID=UPI001FD7FBD7|nr:homocysteine S-methyltransferase family protein [Halomonas salinarum]